MAFILSMETSTDIAECWTEGGLAKPPITERGVRRIAGMARRIEEGVRGPLGALEEDAHAADRRRRAVAGVEGFARGG